MSSFPSEDFSEPLQVRIGDVYLFASYLFLGLSDMPFQEILIKSTNHMVIQLVEKLLASVKRGDALPPVSSPYLGPD
jgi:hypothetical protein